MPQVEEKNYYELLGVQNTASADQIKEAYRELVRIFHPDSRFYDEIVGGKTNAIEEDKAFKLITEAYTTLTNEERRKQYDAMLPKGLKGWEEEEHEFVMSGAYQGPHAKSGAFGVFGVVGDAPASSFDAPPKFPRADSSQQLRSAVVRLSRWQRFMIRLGFRPKF